MKKKIMHILGGTILTEDVFTKNIHFLIVLFVIVILYIGNRYSCIEKMASIEKYRSELKDAKYQSMTISSELTTLSRQSKVQHSIDRYGLGLKTAKEPVYTLKEKDKE